MIDLKSLEATIRRLQKQMGYETFIKESEANRLQYTRDVALALHKEVSEFLDEVPWKPWQPVYAQSIDKEAAAKEICDIIVFAIVLYITTDPLVSLEEAMMRTLTKIQLRIDSGYGKPKE